MGTAHADAKVLSAENSHCQRYAVLEIPAVGQIIAVYASPRALSPACLISAFSVRSTPFSRLVLFFCFVLFSFFLHISMFTLSYSWSFCISQSPRVACVIKWIRFCLWSDEYCFTLIWPPRLTMHWMLCKWLTNFKRKVMFDRNSEFNFYSLWFDGFYSFLLLVIWWLD